MSNKPKILSVAARARLGGLAVASKYHPSQYTVQGRLAAELRFQNEVDPDRVLPESERMRRAIAARKAFFVRLSQAGVEARQKGRREKAA